jgi:hypothetical protein
VVLVRGGSQFQKFCQACLLGSTADDGLFGPRMIGVGLRMRFVSGNVFVLTSPVRSFSRRGCWRRREARLLPRPQVRIRSNSAS